MLHLYIFAQNKWNELELDESFEIALNSSLSNLFNPTEYLTSYSKSITIPLTAKNRKLFNEYVELNSLVVGNRFDPTKPVPVKIFSNSNIIFEGNLKIEKIDLKGHKMGGTVYGDMNKFFVIMKNLTFEDNGGLPNLLNSNAVIDKNYIYDCWHHDLSELNLTMALPGETGHYDRDFVGFAPTIQGIPNQFDLESGIWGVSDYSDAGGYHPTTTNPDDPNGPENKKFWEIIGDDAAMSQEGISNATTVMKAPSERVTCQYRSYTQKPFIYINKLIQLFQRLSLEKTGYELVLDPDFFNSTNRLYTDVIYTLPNLITETSDSNAVKQEFNAFNYSNTNVFRTAASSPHTSYYNMGTFHTTSNGTLEITGSASTNVSFDHSHGGAGIGGYFNWIGNAGIRMVIELIRNGSVAQSKTYKYCGTSNNQGYAKLETAPKYPSPYPPNYSNSYYHYKYYFDNKSFNFKFENLANNADYTVKLTLYLEDSGSSYHYTMGGFCSGQSISAVALQNVQGIFYYSVSMSGKMYYSTSMRSGSELSMKRLWKEVNGTPFEVVMKYCKMLNLVFDYNNRDRKVTLMTRRKYFANSLNRIKDWSNKIDKTQEYSFVPLQWDTKYVTFNYGKLDVDRLADFEKKYNFTYGSKKIDTQYEFNKDNKNFFSGDNNLINPSATMSEYFYTIDDIRTICDQQGTRVPTLSHEHYIINRKGDKSANVSNSFYFRNSNEYWETIRIWDSKRSWAGGDFWTDTNCVWITDDSEYELQTNTFCTQFVWRTAPVSSGSSQYGKDGVSYSNNAMDWKCLCNAYNYSNAATRPVFSVYDDDGQYCLQYSVPRENYYNPDWVCNVNENDIYNAQWKSYFEETHNVQNKVLTAYFWLSDNDWNEFAFNKYVTIDGVLYIVNKVIDYRPGKQTPTKVELIQIWNTGAYSE